MNRFENVWVEFWRSDFRKIPMVTFRADSPKEETKGLNSIWFVLTLEEWTTVLRGDHKAYSDGYHKLDVMGDLWTFFDFELPMQSAGVKEVRYLRAEMPRRARETLMLATAVGFRKYDNQEPSKWGYKKKVTLDLAPYVKEWSERYGQGKGSVYVECSEDAALRLSEVDGKGNFNDMFDRVKQIARNTTHSVDEVGVVRLYKDMDGFFWRAGGMHGGLVNHGTEEEPYWSIHT